MADRILKPDSRQAFSAVVGAVPDLLHIANPLGQELLLASQGGGHLSVRNPNLKIQSLSQQDYPRIKFWYETDWKTYGKDKRAASDGTSITSDYMESNDGLTVSDRRKAEIREVAASLWFEMVDKGRAPAKWSAAPADVKEFFYNGMNSKCDEMRYCHNNWKAQHLATMNYSSFYNNHGQKGLATIKQEPEEGIASNGNHTKRRRGDVGEGNKDKTKKQKRVNVVSCQRHY